jgi:hypothetical protein
MVSFVCLFVSIVFSLLVDLSVCLPVDVAVSLRAHVRGIRTIMLIPYNKTVNTPRTELEACYAKLT